MFKIGDKAKGFKFDSDTDSVQYDNDMDDYVGVIGEVVDSYEDSFVILFPDQLEWMYPASLGHLAKVEEEAIHSFKVGDRVKFKKNSIDSGMIDATSNDVFEIENFQDSAKTMVLLVGKYFQIYHISHFEHIKEEIMEEQKINWEGSQIDWQVGQEVFCLLRGKGVIANTSYGGTYPIEVELEEDFEYYTQDGKFFDYHKNRSLFFSEPVVTAELFPPKKPFVPTLKKGDTILVKSSGFREGVVRVVVEELEDRIIFDEEGNFHMKSQVISVHKIGEEIKFS